MGDTGQAAAEEAAKRARQDGGSADDVMEALQSAEKRQISSAQGAASLADIGPFVGQCFLVAQLA